jgi:acetyl-CoA carboxylase carboxyl transferase subunit alpha
VSLSRGHILDFEKPVIDLENQIQELRDTALSPGIDIQREIKALQKKVGQLIKEIYGNLSPWERVLLSRHPSRPHASDYIENIVDDFHEIFGDRKYADDPAMITGFGTIAGHKVAIVAIEKGRKTKEKVYRNFGMPRPEGYRKAIRVMELAGKFNIPVISFIDTPGAYPGIGAEERGQAQAIAENLAKMFEVPSPIISVVIGEGGSGGALAIGLGDRVMMMEYSIYSVISPESCASILWADPSKSEKAANALKLDPVQAKELNVIDHIIPEPAGGAHRSYEEAFRNVKKSLEREIKDTKKGSVKKRLEDRYKKFRCMGNQTLLP